LEKNACHLCNTSSANKFFLEMFDPSIITDWAIKYKDLAVFIIFVVAFIEAFIITGTFWSSLILLLTTTALYEINANLTFMCIGAACGAFTGDALSFYLGQISGPKIKNYSFVKKRTKFLNKAEAVVKKFGWVGILIGRLTPAIRPYIPFLAAIAGMPNKKFISACLSACAIWACGLFFIVYGLEKIIDYF
tara:strand:+ start:3008 stop:3580 length:573 start_codon:yes stop_codon:yes gene_type:complete